MSVICPLPGVWSRPLDICKYLAVTNIQGNYIYIPYYHQSLSWKYTYNLSSVPRDEKLATCTPSLVTPQIFVCDSKAEAKSGLAIRPVFISIDPERDTPEQVGMYVKGARQMQKLLKTFLIERNQFLWKLFTYSL